MQLTSGNLGIREFMKTLFQEFRKEHSFDKSEVVV